VGGFLAGNDFETAAAALGFGKLAADAFDGAVDGIGGGGADVDLLDLD
jgi:hypothetical protein